MGAYSFNPQENSWSWSKASKVEELEYVDKIIFCCEGSFENIQHAKIFKDVVSSRHLLKVFVFKDNVLLFLEDKVIWKYLVL